jgi:hypothetical protein
MWTAFALLDYALQARQLVMTSPKQYIAITLGLIVTVFSARVGYTQERPCSNVEGRRALEAVILRSWDALYMSYKSYRQCDDGAIGEGYSESVARILVDHWNTLPQLARLSRKDAEFRAFVIGHVDATLNMDDVEKIRKNAKTQCPAGLQTVCSDLAKQADFALKEDASSP